MTKKKTSSSPPFHSSPCILFYTSLLSLLILLLPLPTLSLLPLFTPTCLFLPYSLPPPFYLLLFPPISFHSYILVLSLFSSLPSYLSSLLYTCSPILYPIHLFSHYFLPIPFLSLLLSPPTLLLSHITLPPSIHNPSPLLLYNLSFPLPTLLTLLVGVMCCPTV